MRAIQPIPGIKDPAFKAAAALAKAAERAASGRYLVEGTGLVQQALRSSSKVHAVYALPGEAPALIPLCREAGADLHILGDGLIAKLIGTGYETAVTALAIVGRNLVDLEDLPLLPTTILLAGERIQDPRNVGVLVRTAEAAGCAALLLSRDCAEAHSRAAVRSTTGSILRLPLCLPDDFAAGLQNLRSRGARIVATSAKAPQSLYECDLSSGPVAFVVGNETEGISDTVRECADEFVSLPMAAHGASSLNVTVAAGVLLYEAVRQRQTSG